MLIRRATVTDLGCLTGSTKIDLGPGLNVIHGPNEAGKTTLLRAIRAVLTIKSNVTGVFFEEMRSRAGGYPEVELVFEHDGSTFILRKRFQRQSGTTNLRITSASGSMDELSGEEAESRLREILGVEDIPRQRRSTDHLGVWPLLWVEQGQSGDLPTNHLTDGGREELGKRLSQLSGEVLAGAGGERLLDMAKAEYDRFYTSSGGESTRTGSPLKQVKDQHDTAQQELAKLELREVTHAEAVDDFARVTARIVEIDEQLPDLRKTNAEAQKAVAAVEAIQRKQEQIAAELKAAKLGLQGIQDRVDHRRSLRKDLQRAEGEREDAIRDLKTAIKLEEEHARQDETIVDKLTNSDAQSRRCDRLRRRAAAHVELLRLRFAHGELSDKLGEAKTLHGRVIEAGAKLESEPITRAVVRKLQKLEREAREAQLGLEAAAASVEVTAIDDTEIAFDAEVTRIEAGTSEKRLATSPMRIHVGRQVTIQVTPGGDEIVERRTDAVKSKGKRDNALEAAGVESADEASRRFDEKKGIEKDRELHEQLLKVHAPDGVDALEMQVEATKRKMPQFATAFESASEPSDAPLPDDIDAAGKVLVDVEEAAENSRNALDEARKRLNAHEKKQRQLEGDRRVAEKAKSEKEETAAALGETLKKAVDEQGDDTTLEKQRANAKQTHSKMQKKAGEAETELHELLPDQVRADAERAGQAFKSAEEERGELRVKQIRLETELSAGDLIGLHERLDAARARARATEEEVNRQRRRARAAKVLYQTLRDCRDQARSRYLAPLEQEVANLLPILFPRAQVDFDEKFELTQLNRQTAGADSFADLSGGCQEQIGVLVRLAMAMVLAADNRLVVMLDDALVSTDDERYERMGAVLARCADRLQIVLATCHWGRYRRLGIPKDQVIDLPAIRS